MCLVETLLLSTSSSHLHKMFGFERIFEYLNLYQRQKYANNSSSVESFSKNLDSLYHWNSAIIVNINNICTVSYKFHVTHGQVYVGDLPTHSYLDQKKYYVQSDKCRTAKKSRTVGQKSDEPEEFLFLFHLYLVLLCRFWYSIYCWYRRTGPYIWVLNATLLFQQAAGYLLLSHRLYFAARCTVCQICDATLGNYRKIVLWRSASLTHLILTLWCQ